MLEDDGDDVLLRLDIIFTKSNGTPSVDPERSVVTLPRIGYERHVFPADANPACYENVTHRPKTGPRHAGNEHTRPEEGPSRQAGTAVNCWARILLCTPLVVSEELLS